MLAKLIKIFINNKVCYLKASLSILEACKIMGHTIPRFCYHELLSIAGNCRMCLVELAGGVKPIASCAMPVSNNLQIFLNTPLVFKARENVLEALLINHPLDCPICDQGGECDLQDQAKKFGSWHSRFLFNKKSVENKIFSFFLVTIMNRCINCTRCVRYSAEIIGDEKMGTVLRGHSSEISNYSGAKLTGQIISNIVDLCPVGALTHRFYAFKGRPWEYKVIKSIGCTDSFGNAIYLSYQFNNIVRVSPKFVKKDSTDGLLTDKERYFFDGLNRGRLVSAFANDKFLKKFNIKQLSAFIKHECVKQGSHFVILINDTQSFERLKLLKEAFYKYNLKVGSLTKNTNKENYFNGTRVSLGTLLLKQDIKYIIVSANLELEGPLVNYRLKKLSLAKNKLMNYWFGYQSKNALNCFSIKEIALILEGKKSYSILNLLKEKLLLYFGDSVIKVCGRMAICFKTLLSLVTNNIEVHYIRPTCNSMGFDIAHLGQISSAELKKAKALLAWDLCESEVSLRHFAKDKKIVKYWLDTHGSNFVWKIASALIPSSMQTQEASMLVNNDCKFQLTSKYISRKNLNTTCLDLTASLSYLILPKLTYKHIETHFLLASLLSTRYNEYKYEKCHELFAIAESTVFSSYPFKNYAEESSREGKLLFRSHILANLSINARKSHKNF